jgi:hypothetical protein
VRQNANPREGSGTGLFSTSKNMVLASSCRSLYALALMFPPKLSSHTHPASATRTGQAWYSTLSLPDPDDSWRARCKLRTNTIEREAFRWLCPTARTKTHLARHKVHPSCGRQHLLQAQRVVAVCVSPTEQLVALERLAPPAYSPVALRAHGSHGRALGSPTYSGEKVANR